MEENRKEEIIDRTEAHTNVIPLFGHQPARRTEPPVTDAELAEYRRLRPLLIQMLKEWAVLKSPTGCPVARSILVID